MKKSVLITLITIISFVLFDFLIGKSFLNFLHDANIIESPIEKQTRKENLKKIEKSYRIKNKYFHHTLKSNVKIKSSWGNIRYLTCTDEFGFRSTCNKIKEKAKIGKIIIIGDSFTEGLGLNYSDTFAGMLSKHSQYEIINMGVTSYSPIIYWNKIKYYLDRGLKPDHVFVFIDISDIDDEANYYIKCENNDFVCDRKVILDKISYTKKTEIKVNFPILDQITKEFKKLKRKIKPKNYIYRKDFIRSNWTFIQENEGVKLGINNSLNYMENLEKYLTSKKISLSVAIYPHPAQILYDNNESKQIKIWKEFCEFKCKYFINLFPSFLEDKKKLSEMEIIEKYYIKGDIHFNKIGNKKIFEYLKLLDFIK